MSERRNYSEEHLNRAQMDLVIAYAAMCTVVIGRLYGQEAFEETLAFKLGLIEAGLATGIGMIRLVLVNKPHSSESSREE